MQLPLKFIRSQAVSISFDRNTCNEYMDRYKKFEMKHRTSRINIESESDQLTKKRG